MPDNKLYQNLEQGRSWNPDNEERICVEMENGDLVWLQGEAIQRYKNGKLGTEPMTPERQKFLDEMKRDIIRIAAESYPQK